ncbi:MAG: hypothetical protein KAR76_00810, partial [Methanosarcinales archaeon]|nr:hypothetical protein [Methanosarcinales archaeon]
MFILPIADASDGNCLGCHDNTAAYLDVNVSAMNASAHANLNNLTPLSNASINPLNKACWACHGNGTEPAGNHSKGTVNATNPANYTTPLNCNDGDCHINGTPPGSSISGPPIPIVIEHVPKINTSTDIDTPDNCSYCHNQSLTPRVINDSNATNVTVLSNVSHYSSTSSLISTTVDCSLCHKNASIGIQWNVSDQIRHPVNKSIDFCQNCHDNGASFHKENLSRGADVHTLGFDWEGDGIDYKVQSGSQRQDNEGCYACHKEDVSPMATILDDNTNLCEECHYVDATGPFSDKIQLRSDINSTMPRVVNHINRPLTIIPVPNQSGAYSTTTQITPSTCFSFDNNTGNGSCHGVSQEKNASAGGFYAFDRLGQPNTNMSPYRFTQTIDHLPNTSDCRICHLGANTSIGILVESNWWGYPSNVTDLVPGVPAHLNNTSTVEECWSCHAGGIKPLDFHSADVTRGGDPDCIKCHQMSSTNVTHHINTTTFNGSVHAGMNALNATSQGYFSDNGACWACHDNDGNMTAGMGDRFANPFACVDCHVPGGAKYGVVYNGDTQAARPVLNHYNGANISALWNMTGAKASCINCHENISSMVLYNNDSDTGSFVGDGERLTGGNLSFYHYGDNRSAFGKTPGSVDYCAYCHRNVTGEFSGVFTDSSNTSILNHSLRFNSTNPGCNVSECHNSTGYQFHDAPLNKPANNDSLCLACHGATKTYSGNMVTTNKSWHNQTVNCTSCHANNATEIHPMSYLQDDSTYSTNNASAVDCVRCHNNNTSFDSNFTFLRPLVADDNG